MKLAIITQPDFVNDEAIIINSLLALECDYVHIRKPHADKSEVAQLLGQIDERFHRQLKLHYHKDLLKEFPFLGFHHSGDSTYDEDIWFRQSKSFHSLEELQKSCASYEYGFVSPIYPSISKQGHLPKYALNEIKGFLECQEDFKCYALGGVTEKNVNEVENLGFDGAAFLGEIWNQKNYDDIMEKFVRIKKTLNLCANM